MADAMNKKTEENLEEVLISRSSEDEESNIRPESDMRNASPVQAVNVSKHEDNELQNDDEEGSSSSIDNVIPLKSISNGWNVVTGWVKMGAEKAAPIWEQTKKVTSDTYEATGPTRAQLYDMSVKMANDIGPASKTMGEMAEGTFNAVSEAVVSTSTTVSTTLNNVTNEFVEFASEMQNGPSSTQSTESKTEKKNQTV